MSENKIKVISDGKYFEIGCDLDIFSESKREICNYVSSVNGSIVDSNTIMVNSDESMIALANELLLLTISANFSKKR